MDENVHTIKDAVELYRKISNYMVEESEKLKNKLDDERGLVSGDIASMLEQFKSWRNTLDIIEKMMKPVLKSRIEQSSSDSKL